MCDKCCRCCCRRFRCSPCSSSSSNSSSSSSSSSSNSSSSTNNNSSSFSHAAVGSVLAGVSQNSKLIASPDLQDLHEFCAHAINYRPCGLSEDSKLTASPSVTAIRARRSWRGSCSVRRFQTQQRPPAASSWPYTAAGHWQCQQARRWPAHRGR